MVAVAICSATPLNAQNMEYKNMFPRGEEFKSPYFTGKVWLEMLSDRDPQFNCPIGNVTFEPGCRNNWHKHPGGQILLCISGEGYYCERGGAIRKLFPGDVVRIAPDVEHWHGATPDSLFSHLSIETNANASAAVWFEPVTDAQYGAYKEPADVALTDAARRRHELWWPGYQSTVKQTDPDLIEVFDNFAFDDVMNHGTLHMKTRALITAASNIAVGAVSEYRMTVRAALNLGATPAEVKEVLYQAVPYVGIARTLDFIHATNDELMARGVKLPLESQSTSNRSTRTERGAEVLKEIFGTDQVDNMYRNTLPTQRHIQDYLVGNCFGDHVSRSGLDLKTRELLTFSMLISLGGCESQVKGHIHGNVGVGNDKATLLAAVTHLIPYIGYPRALNALACLNEVLPEK